jgi:hypothetical protein
MPELPLAVHACLLRSGKPGAGKPSAGGMSGGASGKGSGNGGKGGKAMPPV